MDYRETLNLPQTDFPMRGNLPKREPEIQEKWEKEDTYNKILEARKDAPLYVLHDGPPYANGNIHLGHALNKILKDIVMKYKTLRGYKTPYVPGWDTHGLPIEHQVVKTEKINKHEIDSVELRKKCEIYARKFVDIQKEQFKRLGILGDWDNPYLTLQHDYEAKQIEVFGEMANKGYIYKGLKPVYWCASCETALAEAEVEYADKTSASIYVKFALPLEEKAKSIELSKINENINVVIWTTTPWTLPANVAISINPDFVYALVKVHDEVYLIAKDLVEQVMKELGIEEFEVLMTIDGQKLEGLQAQHPFMDRMSTIILGEHVTLEQGTGCVHTAPGHGQEDFEVGLKYKLPVINPVQNNGVFTQEAGKYAGMHINKANPLIIEDLKESGALLHTSEITHQYPHCWRCKHPIVFRATEQWFASVDGFRKEALNEIKNVKWIPTWGQDRITNMVADRYDWCISRQRVWGVPIPIFYCKSCNKELINDETIKAVADLFRREGSNAWFAKEPNEMLPEGIVCPECGGRHFRKETDIMDVWFDSGTSHEAVLETRPELRGPADLYLEGSDQHRGWFQSSLLTSVATKGKAPYEAVLTHGYVVDGEGKKMSKSLGNVISPQKVIDQYGADILRLWVASSDFKSDIRVSSNILKQMAEVYRRIRNTCRFILGNLYDFVPENDKVDYEELMDLDKWALLRLHKLIKRVTQSYEDFEFHMLYHDIHNFCAVDMSSFYLDVLKDRLYTCGTNSVERRAAQTVMYEILVTLVKLFAPILPHTATEVWQYLPGAASCQQDVIFTDWPHVTETYLDEKLADRWDNILKLRDEISKALEGARRNKTIGHALDAKVTVYLPEDSMIPEMVDESLLKMVCIVSQMEFANAGDAIEDDFYISDEISGLKIKIEQAPGVKCERCWMYSEEIGQDEAHSTLCPRCAEVARNN